MRVVIDASVLAAGLLNPAGLAANILRRWMAGTVVGFTSEALLAETSSTYQTEKRRRRTFDEAWATDVIAFLTTHAVTSSVWPLPIVPIRDPRDTHVISLSLLVGADLIVSSDKDLLTLGTIEGIPVVDIHAFAYTLGIRH